jgi:integrase
MLGDQGVRLYEKPNSPFKFYDFTFKGKRYRGSTGEKTERAAMKSATTYRDKLAADDPSTRKRTQAPTLQEFAKDFLKWAEESHTLDPNTVKYYKYGIRLLGFSELACVPVNQINAKLIETTKFVRPVVDRKKSKDTGEKAIKGERAVTDDWVECSKSYTQQAQRTLRVILGKAAEWEQLPARVSFAIGKTPGRIGLITPQIEGIILRELSGYRTKRPWLVLMTMMDTGARPSEVFAMRLENIDWAGRRIFIPAGKTEQAKRWVGMTERMHKELSTWCRGSEGPGWLFPSRVDGSKHGHLNSIASSFKSACVRGGLDTKLVPYLARHTFGTTAMRATGNTFAVMKAMGHASVLSMAPYQHQETDQLTTVMNQRNAGAVQPSPVT